MAVEGATAQAQVQARGTDWTTSFDEAAFRDEFCRIIREWKVGALQRFPPPKSSGLPFGHELRIARRFLSGRSSLLDESGLSSAYRLLASERQRLVYRAVVLGEPLARAEWQALVGSAAVGPWTERGLLREEAGGRLAARFRVIALDDLLFVTDPLTESFPLRVHIGQDSLNMVEFVRPRVAGRTGLSLDVGPGTGVLLIALGRGRESGLGVDINPRAMRVATLNAHLNGAHHCRVVNRDIFQADLGEKFDLVTWNTPFMFMPESWAERSVDGYGGHLGIEISLRFVERLPHLLRDDGAAYVLSAAPQMTDGTNRLDDELRARVKALGLDVVGHVLQTFWVPELRDFYHQHGVKRFESIMLEVTRGAGSYGRREMPAGQVVVDRARRFLYEVARRGRPVSGTVTG